MNLQEYISESLVQIVNGINDANEKLKGTGASVPKTISAPANAEKYTRIHTAHSTEIVADINFDVKIEIVESQNTEGGGGLKLHVASFGANHEVKDSTSSSQRLQFTLPLSLPGKSD